MTTKPTHQGESKENSDKVGGRGMIADVLGDTKQLADHEAVEQAKIAERWETLKAIPNLFGQLDELLEKMRSGEYEIPKESDWLKWKDWGNMLKSFAEKRDVGFFDLTKAEREKLSEDIAALLITMFVNVDSFNRIHKQFPNEEYIEGWNAFFILCRSINNLNIVDPHRVLSLSGIDLHGLSPGPVFHEFVNLSGANLKDCDLTGAETFKNAKFRGADLSGAIFDNRFLTGIGVDFTGAKITTDTSFKGAFAYQRPDGLPDWAVQQMHIKYAN